MDDSVQRHPTRAEQLDILVSVLAATCSQNGSVADLGCGQGYVAHLLLAKRPDLRYVGVDRDAQAVAAATQNLAPYPAVSLFEADLSTLDSNNDIPCENFDAVVSALTFHDLTDDTKQATIAWARSRLGESGVFLLYDRVRLTEPALFECQKVIWDRIEAIHGVSMRRQETFGAYQHDIGTDNRPASVRDYLQWFEALGLSAQLLHLHGNVALFASTPAK